jgi:tRNA uridine 5-carbamoylmethylation protein Kti12
MVLQNAGLVLIAGIPASGKTTLAKGLESTAPTGVTVCRWTVDEHPNNGSLRTKNDALFSKVQSALQSGPRQIHIIDDTFHLKSMRRRYVRLAQQRRIACCHS